MGSHKINRCWKLDITWCNPT